MSRHNRNFDTVSKGQYTAKILQDEDPMNPREWDNLGVMVCFHRRYNLGDEKHGYSESDFSSWNELKAEITRREDPAIIIPLRLYDHSGISISTSCSYPYDDQWDSGWVGFIFVSKAKVRENWSIKHITKKYLKRAAEVLEAEVKEYDDYLTGNVFGYQLFKITDPNFDPDFHDPEEFGEEIDSCWGYYGDAIKEEVNRVIDDCIKEDEKKEWESLPAREAAMVA